MSLQIQLLMAAGKSRGGRLCVMYICHVLLLTLCALSLYIIIYMSYHLSHSLCATNREEKKRGRRRRRKKIDNNGEEMKVVTENPVTEGE